MQEYNNHLKIGNETVLHKGKNIVSSFNSTSFEAFVKDLDEKEFVVYTVPIEFERRADLISNHVYGDSSLDWLVCYFNNIEDPFQELISGKKIKIALL